MQGKSLLRGEEGFPWRFTRHINRFMSFSFRDRREDNFDHTSRESVTDNYASVNIHEGLRTLCRGFAALIEIRLRAREEKPQL